MLDLSQLINRKGRGRRRLNQSQRNPSYRDVSTCLTCGSYRQDCRLNFHGWPLVNGQILKKKLAQMKKAWVVTQQAFDSLLDWLDSDREQAGQKYENIRLRLIKIFTCRGCGEADDLADETINRVTAKLADIADTYSGEPALYFYGVAQKVHLEYLRNQPRVQESSLIDRGPSIKDRTSYVADEVEQEYACLEHCMDQLPQETRRLVLEYYQEEKRAKIDHRKKLAEQLGIALNALRIRAHRIRLQLQHCVESCLEQVPAH